MTSSPMVQDWASFWAIVSARLGEAGYAEGTRQQYRHILRAFYRSCRCPPDAVNRETVRDYLYALVDREVTASWLGMNVSVLRTVFHDIFGHDVVKGFSGISHPDPLPEMLNRRDVHRLLNASDTLRDRVLLSLVYGCGLKAGEVCGLRWEHIDLPHRRIRLPVTSRRRRGRLRGPEGRGADGCPPRDIPLPAELVPLLEVGAQQSAPEDDVFPGVRPGEPITRRTVERVVKRAAKRAGLSCTVTAMTLRHSFAVHCLEDGWSIRQLQTVLGHRHILTTMRYRRCIAPRLPPLNTRPAPQRAGAEIPLAPVVPLESLARVLRFGVHAALSFRQLLKFPLRGSPFRSKP